MEDLLRLFLYIPRRAKLTDLTVGDLLDAQTCDIGIKAGEVNTKRVAEARQRLSAKYGERPRCCCEGRRG